MAATPTPGPTRADAEPARPTRPVECALSHYHPPLPLGVAYSGGADSTALLLACAERWPGQVVALHVHHGLQAAADDFERHCRVVCAAVGLPLRVARVDARHGVGESPQDAARRARYRALATLAANADEGPVLRHVALAQHADDQVETVLLALSRGAGLPGLAAMGPTFERDGLSFDRPLLGVPAADLRAWLAGRDAVFVEDPSNGDTRYTRNRIRAQLLPALAEVFPQFRDTFARSARHAAQAQRLLTELALADLATVGMPPRIQALQRLSDERLVNVLRHWLRQLGCVPSSAQLDELAAQVQACTTRSHRLHLKVGQGHVRRLEGQLDWYN